MPDKHLPDLSKAELGSSSESERRDYAHLANRRPAILRLWTPTLHPASAEHCIGTHIVSLRASGAQLFR